MGLYSRTGRNLCVAAFGVVVAPLLVGSVAYACTNLSNLQANPGSGAAGATIRVTGSNFRTEVGVSGPVEIQLDSRSGPVIATLPMASINAVGRTISLDVPIPASAALGFHTLIATQRNVSTRALLSGFPVRATYKVTAAAVSRATEATEAAAPAADAVEPVAPAAVATSAARVVAPDVPVAQAVAAAPRTATAPAAVDAAPVAPVAPVEPASSPALPVAAVVADSPVASAAMTTSSPAAAMPTDVADSATFSGGLLPAGTGGEPSALPTLTLALGAGIVLLSLLAFVKSGRSVLFARRMTSLA